MLEDWQWRHLCYVFGQCVPHPQSRNLKGPATNCEMLEGNWCLLTVINGGKIKGAILLTGVLAGCSSPFCKPLSLKVKVCGWPERCQTYGYLPSRRASSLLIGSGSNLYCLVTEARVCVWTTCLRLLPESGTVGSQTATPQVTSPTS